ncbi:MAG: hypothetical protein MZV64_23750 [Ignavibacteriales bacterium]|nr:hypothetical protein [Ignavibacteriales bacterium]
MARLQCRHGARVSTRPAAVFRTRADDSARRRPPGPGFIRLTRLARPP